MAQNLMTGIYHQDARNRREYDAESICSNVPTITVKFEMTKEAGQALLNKIAQSPRNDYDPSSRAVMSLEQALHKAFFPVVPIVLADQLQAEVGLTANGQFTTVALRDLETGTEIVVWQAATGFVLDWLDAIRDEITSGGRWQTHNPT